MILDDKLQVDFGILVWCDTVRYQSSVVWAICIEASAKTRLFFHIHVDDQYQATFSFGQVSFTYRCVEYVVLYWILVIAIGYNSRSHFETFSLHGFGECGEKI